ncbi:hypothetical protein [Staphylococcus saprophyticus]|uniref:hypothetical protein n=1 Tax=Staphylococcus saprophyticus TaxID=29385 RepID=UPI001642DA81|nr:hypothetical protein [Staphylococcus saprophyticus]
MVIAVIKGVEEIGEEQRLLDDVKVWEKLGEKGGVGNKRKEGLYKKVKKKG